MYAYYRKRMVQNKSDEIVCGTVNIENDIIKYVNQKNSGRFQITQGVYILLYITLGYLRIKNIFSVCSCNQNDSICFLKPTKNFRTIKL